MLSYPEFMPLPYTESIANKDFYDEDGNKFDGPKTYFTSTVGVSLLVGQFLDYLRENGVYDNTRIIIVADHGYPTDRWEKYQVTIIIVSQTNTDRKQKDYEKDIKQE